MNRAWPLLLAVGCRPDAGPSLPLDPPSGSMAGYFEVQADLSEADFAASQVSAVWVGDVAAYGLVATDDALSFIVQGSAVSGAQRVRWVLDDGTTVDDVEGFTYAPPRSEVFDRMVAMGASLTQGVQGGVPVARGVLHSPPHLIARQAGAYMPLPMLVDPLFPTIGWDDIGPPPACEVPNVVTFIATAAIEVLSRLEDEETGQLNFAKARVDPQLEIRNVGVGDTDLAGLVHGPPNDPAELFVVKMVYAPDAGITEGVATSQLELVEALEPSIVLVADTYGNDLIGSIVMGSAIDPGRITDEPTFTADLEELASRLSATGADSFLANLPLPSVLPATAERRRAAIDSARADAEARGDDPDAAEAEAAAEVDALIAEIEAIGARFNDILDAVAATHGNVHVVDFAGMTEAASIAGQRVGDITLGTGKFGGLLSTDGVHFGDVGYATLSNAFIDRINAVLGTDVPPIDLATELADDPYSPAAARAAGVDPEACQ